MIRLRILAVAISMLWCISVTAQSFTGHSSNWQKSFYWQQPDPLLPSPLPARLLGLTDLPLLAPPPTPKDTIEAINKSRAAGCNAAVLSFSWPSLEPKPHSYQFDELLSAIRLNQGRALFLGIQVINTTTKELPHDLRDKSFDDAVVLSRFSDLLDALQPLLNQRLHFLAIGNEVDVYLAGHPDELAAYQRFLTHNNEHLKKIAPELIIGSTVTSTSATKPEIQWLTQSLDAHFLTFYTTHQGLDTDTNDGATHYTQQLHQLAQSLDQRPLVFQEVGSPTHPELGSEQQQSQFINALFDTWELLGDRIRLINYFLLYDFPEEFVTQLIGYYGATDEQKTLNHFIGSLGLHDAQGKPKSGWKTFVERAQRLKHTEQSKGDD